MEEKRELLTQLLNQCLPSEQKLFERMYLSVSEIGEDKIDWAIKQCIATLKLPHHVIKRKINERNRKIDNLL